MEEHENERRKPKATKKEILMVIIVVVAAFGLTVVGIVYLTNFLIGGEQPAPATSEVTQPVFPEVDNNTVLFTEEDQLSADTAIPVVSAPPADTVPVVTTPATPSASASLPATAAPVATTPVVTTPAATAPVATNTPVTTPIQTPPAVTIPTSSPTRGTYQLQLFAFRSQETANAEALKYVAQYPDIYVVRADLGTDGVWYRVRCCSNNSQEALSVIKTEIERNFNIQPYIVKVQ